MYHLVSIVLFSSFNESSFFLDYSIVFSLTKSYVSHESHCSDPRSSSVMADKHSYANLSAVHTTSLHFEVAVDFEKQKIAGFVDIR